MSEINILDASAVLALLQGEKGQDVVHAAMIARPSQLSAVNYAEVLGKLCEHGVPEADAETAINTLNVRIVTFDQSQVVGTALLKARTKSIGASLGDRACLALAGVSLDATDHPLVLTAEKQWSKLKWPFKIIQIR